jgi:DUF4097 and DUF4098 domain-containing protein YvlB
MPRFDTAAPDVVHVRLTAGSLHVITGDRDSASITINPADPDRAKDVEAADRATAELTDGRLVVDAADPRRLTNLVIGPNRPGFVDLVLEVPDGVALTVAGQIVTVRVDGRLGRTEIRTQVGALHLDHTADVTARTSGGEVTLRHATGQAKIQGSGAIELGTLVGPAEVKNLTGSIHVGTAEGPLRLRTATGDLVVDAAATDLHARTSTGAITVGAAQAGLLDLRTPSGTIRVGVVEGTSVLVDATTKLGRVEQRLEATEGPASSDRRAEIRAHTSMGDVVIHRA